MCVCVCVCVQSSCLSVCVHPIVAIRYPSRKEQEGKVVPRITMAEFQQHSTVDDLWVCIDGHAYDITSYAKHHPGGQLPLTHVSTSLFLTLLRFQLS